jgi:hypothetical protein
MLAKADDCNLLVNHSNVFVEDMFVDALDCLFLWNAGENYLPSVVVSVSFVLNRQDSLPSFLQEAGICALR